MNIKSAVLKLMESMEEEVQHYRELLKYLNEETRQLKSFSASELVFAGQKKEIVLKRRKVMSFKAWMS